MRRLILDYASTVNPITELLRKDQDFEWTPEVQKEFANIKDAIVSSPILVSPNFDNHLILYSFSSEDTIEDMLTQKNKKGEELPIYFLNKELYNYELKYSPLEKKPFA